MMTSFMSTKYYLSIGKISKSQTNKTTSNDLTPSIHVIDEKKENNKVNNFSFRWQHLTCQQYAQITLLTCIYKQFKNWQNDNGINTLHSCHRWKMKNNQVNNFEFRWWHLTYHQYTQNPTCQQYTQNTKYITYLYLTAVYTKHL